MEQIEALAASLKDFVAAADKVAEAFFDLLEKLGEPDGTSDK